MNFQYFDYTCTYLPIRQQSCNKQNSKAYFLLLLTIFRKVTYALSKGCSLHGVALDYIILKGVSYILSPSCLQIGLETHNVVQ